MRAHKHSKLDPSDDGISWVAVVLKTCLFGLLLFVCAYLLFFPFSSLSHVHLRELGGFGGHKGAAFCAFTRTCHQPPGASTGVGAPGVGATPAHTLEATQAGPGPGHTLPGSTLAEAHRALITRVCGSPAIDGYTKVNGTCMEHSPTNKWFHRYYRAGGKQGDLAVHYDRSSSYDGLAVAWGLTNKKKSVEECAQHCSSHMPGNIPGPFAVLPCNAFVFCPDPECWEPDAHHSTFGDCWLKFTEAPANPEVNVRGAIPDYIKRRHPEAPPRVQWVSGVLLPHGVPLGNGTWSPRHAW